MPEIALNLPFDANEIKDIACAEFRKRLDGLSPIQGAKEYVKFALDFNVKIHVWRNGESGPGKETLAWGSAGAVAADYNFPGSSESSAEISASPFESKDPNAERMSRDMALTVETTDGRGGKTRRKVRVKE